MAEAEVLQFADEGSATPTDREILAKGVRSAEPPKWAGPVVQTLASGPDAASPPPD